MLKREKKSSAIASWAEIILYFHNGRLYESKYGDCQPYQEHEEVASLASESNSFWKSADPVVSTQSKLEKDDTQSSSDHFIQESSSQQGEESSGQKRSLQRPSLLKCVQTPSRFPD